MHGAYIGGRSENNINASCMTISGGRTKKLDIFCRLTGFTSDFLSFIVVELIRFFHGAIQFTMTSSSVQLCCENKNSKYPGFVNNYLI